MLAKLNRCFSLVVVRIFPLAHLQGKNSIATLIELRLPSPLKVLKIRFSDYSLQTLLLHENKLSFSVANHFTHLTSSMFPECKIATKFSSARKETQHVFVKGTL